MALTLSNDANSQWFRNVDSIKQQDCSFSRTEKKSNHSKRMKGFSITRGSNIFRRRSDHCILAEGFCQHQIENYFGG